MADYATNHLFVVTANKTTQASYLLMYAPYKYHRSAPKAIRRKGQPSDTSNKTYPNR